MGKQEEINIRNLLNQVNLISKHYDRIASLTGENFNIFSIMSMERNEVYTHSAIISELLNPNGNHGQGDIFLKAFIEIINNKIVRENEIPYLSNCEVLKEHTIKEFSQIKPCSGRIDIYITNKKQSIIIENKIDAESQPDQLLRYYNYAVNKYKDKFWLIYLQKTENNHTNDDLDYSCGFTENFSNINSYSTKNKIIKITYENEILLWLKECLKHTSNLPMIRETINQYIHLVNKITSQLNNNIMSDEIINIIAENPEYVKAIETLYEAIGKNEYHDLKIRLVNNMIRKLKLKVELNGLFFIQNCTKWENESAFTIFKEGWIYGICFEFTDNNFNNLDVGIRLINDSDFNNHNESLYNNVREVFGYNNKPSNKYWLGWERYQEWNSLHWYEFADDIACNKVFEKIIKLIKTIEENSMITL